jgi:uncharacterized phosphosugar-binding protein
MLLVFGSGHSQIFPLELYHRAGGPSFVLPVTSFAFSPLQGPGLVRIMERTAGSANGLLDRVDPKPGEMLWLCSQSGINAALIDLALHAKQRKLFTVAFTSKTHSESVPSRHSSGKRLFEVCDEVVDLGGERGDAAVPLGPRLPKAGPLSTLGAVFLAHSILVSALSELERRGRRCVYTSVNTPEGEKRNLGIETHARIRDRLLR